MSVGHRSFARLALVASGLALVMMGMAWQRGESTQTSPFEGTVLPDPPRQREPWEAPATAVPKPLVDATARLFEQGLADPRGCEYREIEVGVGSPWTGDGGVVKTRGWVLPPVAGQASRFAVAWSGLVYPTVSVGAAADLAADVAVISKDAAASGSERFKFGGFVTNEESSSVSPRSLHSVKVCLLLRLGRADLAEAVWRAGKPDADDERRGQGLSYLSMATDLAWYRFDRAVCAHMRGDDKLALIEARKLTAFRASAEELASKLGFGRPQLINAGPGPHPFIGFLGQLPDLLADQERRAIEPKRPPVPPPGGDPGARIAALIADLDQIANRQMGQPGGVSLWGARLKALVDAGEPAVEPLLEAIQRDVRLTRSVMFHRDFMRSRSIQTANQAEMMALSSITRLDSFAPAPPGASEDLRDPAGRKLMADHIRRLWAKDRGVPIYERYFRTLADDQAPPGEWLKAAALIAQPLGESIIPRSTALVGVIWVSDRNGVKPRTLSEAALRPKQNPSVADLIRRRIGQVDPGVPLDPKMPENIDVRSANQLALLLAEWDGKAALPELKARVARCAEVVRAGQRNGRRTFGVEASLAVLTNVRLKLGDPEALDDYAAWVRTLTPGRFDYFPFEMLEPLVSHPDHPAIREAAASLFGDPNSPWNPGAGPRGDDSDRGGPLRLLGSSLLGLEPFRSLVLRALADQTPLGTVEVDAGGAVTVIEGETTTVSDGNRTSVSGGSGRRARAGPGAMPLRLADLACEQLQQLQGIPRFQKQWPLAKRDEAIAATVAYLKRYGERFRDNDASRAIRRADPGDTDHEQPIFAFDPLDRPATAADVAAGRAIFTLEAPGVETRRFSMPTVPIDARWTKLVVFKDDPPRTSVYDVDGNELDNTEALQAGRIWQAEEVREGGRWRRSYGFVGRHAVARVPAEEVEFLCTWRERWRPLSSDLDGWVELKVKEAATAGPVPVEVSFRNHRGVEATAPVDLVRDADGAPSVREGITFRLVRESDDPVDRTLERLNGETEKPSRPEEVAARPIRRHPRGAAPRPLEAAHAVDAFRIDLRQVFPLDRPGRYRLEIGFDDLKTRDGQPGKVFTVFPVVAR